MKKDNVLIWGAANAGKETYMILNEYNSINIIGFADNNKLKRGRIFCGKRVFSLIEVIEQLEIDYIVIASMYYEQIYYQLTTILDVPIYKNVLELVDFRVSIDISGWCNAKCKWCVTGIKNRGKKKVLREYMPYEYFKKIYDYMLKIRLIHPFNEILLYNWGEPFLNPDYFKIIEFLNEKNQVYSLSTNASVLKLANEKINSNIYSTCKTVVFSMSGFSQNSYDKIHGFSIEKIKENIQLLITNMREKGFNGDGILSYHVYQFSKKELEEAKEFSIKLDLKFIPIYSYFAGWSLMEKYLTNALSSTQLKEAKQDLFLFHVEELIKSRPDKYNCVLENMLSINCLGNIELCCHCDDKVGDYTWGSLFEVKNVNDWQKLRMKMMSSNTCKECRLLGIDYWIGNNPEYEVNFL